MSMDRRLAVAGLMVAVFVSGAVTGGVLSRSVLDHRPSFADRWDPDRRDFERRGDREGPDRGRRGDRPREPRALISSRAVDHLAERLELDEAQRDSLGVILERQRERASAVFRDVGPRLRAVLDSTNSQIRDMLDPVQQAEFDTIIQEDRDVLGRRFVPRDSAEGR